MTSCASLTGSKDADTSDYINLSLLCDEEAIWTYWHQDDTDASILEAKQRNAYFLSLCPEGPDDAE